MCDETFYCPKCGHEIGFGWDSMRCPFCDRPKEDPWIQWLESSEEDRTDGDEQA